MSQLENILFFCNNRINNKKMKKINIKNFGDIYFYNS